MTIAEYVLLCAIALFAGFVQGLTGFGSVIVALPLLTFFLNIKVAAPLANLISLGISAYLCLRMRRSLHWPRILPLAIASLPGIWLGAQLLQSLSAKTLEQILGLVLIFLSMHGVLKPRDSELPRGWACLAGFASGLLGGSIGAYGPPAIAYAALQPWDRDAVKSTMVGYFSLASLGILVFHAQAGAIESRVLTLLALALPFLGVGAWMGSVGCDWLNDRSFIRFILIMLFLLGILLVFR